ncbi:hypothetical protein PUN28_003429 [Cardiocondyla obscurior]|uniref:Uncharacterized protein n=1 Tax=Cardiocondyla obscurior TaxID=286306 RepID=A0AAW2GKU3_9HYME
MHNKLKYCIMYEQYAFDRPIVIEEILNYGVNTKLLRATCVFLSCEEFIIRFDINLEKRKKKKIFVLFHERTVLEVECLTLVIILSQAWYLKIIINDSAKASLRRFLHTARSENSAGGANIRENLRASCPRTF